MIGGLGPGTPKRLSTHASARRKSTRPCAGCGLGDRHGAHACAWARVGVWVETSQPNTTSCTTCVVIIRTPRRYPTTPPRHPQTHKTQYSLRLPINAPPKQRIDARVGKPPTNQQGKQLRGKKKPFSCDSATHCATSFCGHPCRTVSPLKQAVAENMEKVTSTCIARGASHSSPLQGCVLVSNPNPTIPNGFMRRPFQSKDAKTALEPLTKSGRFPSMPQRSPRLLPLALACAVTPVSYCVNLQTRSGLEVCPMCAVARVGNACEGSRSGTAVSDAQLAETSLCSAPGGSFKPFAE